MYLDGGGGVGLPIGAHGIDCVGGRDDRRGCGDWGDPSRPPTGMPKFSSPYFFLVCGWFSRGSFSEVHPRFSENCVILKDGCIHEKESERMLSDAGGEVIIILRLTFNVLPSNTHLLRGDAFHVYKAI